MSKMRLLICTIIGRIRNMFRSDEIDKYYFVSHHSAKREWSVYSLINGFGTGFVPDPFVKPWC